MSAVLAPPTPVGMIPTVSARVPLLEPRPWKWTREQYYDLGKRGFFLGKRVELLRGEILVMCPPNEPHVTSVSLVTDVVRLAFGLGYFVRVQAPLSLGQESDPEPDVAVVAGSPRDYHNHPTSALLAIEVSDSTLFHDLTTKAELYATAGVPDYWVIDVEGRCLHVFRDPVTLPAGLGETAYSTHLTLAATEIVSPLAAPHATITIADLLP